MRRARCRRLFRILPLLVTTGCYGYAPLASPQPGMEVRAQLTPEAAARRSQGTGAPVLSYDGVVVGATPESLALDVLVARASSGLRDVVIRDTMTIPAAEIRTVLRRKLSVGRTTLFTLAAGAGAAAVVLGIDQIVGGTGEPPDDGNPTFRTPVLSWQSLRVLLGF